MGKYLNMTVACKALHYGSAIAVTLFLAATALSGLGQANWAGKHIRLRRRRLLYLALYFLVGTYVVEAIVASRLPDAFVEEQAHVIHVLVSGVMWLVIAFQQHPPLFLLLGASFTALLLETALLALSALGELASFWSIVGFVCQACRILVFLFVVLDLSLVCTRPPDAEEEEEEAQALLRGQTVHVSYDATPLDDDANPDQHDSVNKSGNDGSGSEYDSDDDEADASIKRRRAERLKETGGWLGYVKDFAIFMPFLIPKKDRKVQLCIAVSLLCIVCRRVLNVFIPRQLAIVTDGLLAKQAPYKDLAIWLLLSLLNDATGLGWIETLTKIPIEQFAYRQVTTTSFAHVMSLPMEFHADRDSGELMKAVEQGQALTNLLQTLVVDILPTVADLFVAYGLLYYKFNAYVALAMVVASVAYVSVEMTTSGWNVPYRRRCSKLRREEARVMHQAVQGWQTVAYFDMFRFEQRRFAGAVGAQQAAVQTWTRRDATFDAVLDALPHATFFVLAGLVAHEILQGRASAGDFVFLIQYWDFLMWPLRFLSHNYRYFMADLVDAERLMGLLRTKPTIVDKEGAEDLLAHPVEGRVVFEQVGFSYDAKRPILRDVSLAAEPGQTVALVGETGAGKSTITKLLLRFYDVTSGSVTIDGRDIRDVTLSSLRGAVGIVPQDPLLFNASVLENVRYARPTATDAEVFEACRAAAIHDKILTLTDGYNTKVGEQGVKLSGGEVQRVAIARAFLKDSPILILDEATSAVDAKTESAIQRALHDLKRGKTTFVVAHRLSTIVGADKILVIHDGQVVESGTHSELIEKGGRYKDLWARQVEGASKGDISNPS